MWDRWQINCFILVTPTRRMLQQNLTTNTGILIVCFCLLDPLWCLRPKKWNYKFPRLCANLKIQPRTGYTNLIQLIQAPVWVTGARRKRKYVAGLENPPVPGRHLFQVDCWYKYHSHDSSESWMLTSGAEVETSLRRVQPDLSSQRRLGQTLVSSWNQKSQTFIHENETMDRKHKQAWKMFPKFDHLPQTTDTSVHLIGFDTFTFTKATKLNWWKCVNLKKILW